MIEQTLEKKIVDKMSEVLAGMNIQVIGAWQPTTSGQIKSLEDMNATGYLTVRMQPRSYETPTIPTAQVPCTIDLVMRTEVDSTGETYLNATEAISNAMQTWQDSIDAAVEYFTIEDKFDVAGFQLNGGSVSSNKMDRVWQYTQTFIVYGVIH